MLSLIRRHPRRNEDGASAVEYGLLVAAIAAIIVVIVFALGQLVAGGFSKTCSTMNSNTSAPVTGC